jgi:hypothetical protein
MRENASPKYLEARSELPETLWPAFERLVADYKYFATVRHGSGYVSYRVLADLVKNGWSCAPDGAG